MFIKNLKKSLKSMHIYLPFIIIFIFLGIEFLEVFQSNKINSTCSSCSLIQSNNKFGVTTPSGKVLIEPKYDEIFFMYDSDMFRVKQNSKYGLIDKNGASLTEIKYEKIGAIFSEDRLDVMLNGKWGFIDRSGTEIIKPYYEEIYFFLKD